SLASINGDLLIGITQPLGSTTTPGEILRVERNTGAPLHTYTDPSTLPTEHDALGAFMVTDGNTIYSVAIDRTTPSTQQVVVALDGTTGSVTHTFSEPVPTPSLGDAFGSPFAVDAGTHDVFIPSGANDIVYQFHSNGTLVRNYTDPVTAGEGFGFALAASSGKLVVGAQYAYVTIDPDT